MLSYHSQYLNNCSHPIQQERSRITNIILRLKHSSIRRTQSWFMGRESPDSGLSFSDKITQSTKKYQTFIRRLGYAELPYHQSRLTPELFIHLPGLCGQTLTITFFLSFTRDCPQPMNSLVQNIHTLGNQPASCLYFLFFLNVIKTRSVKPVPYTIKRHWDQKAGAYEQMS